MESLPPPNLDETPSAIPGPWTLYDYFIQEGLFDKYLGTSEKLNPLKFMDQSFPPTVLVHGDRDALVPLYFSERIVSTLRSDGGSAFLMVVPGGDHGFEAFVTASQTSKLWSNYLEPCFQRLTEILG